MDEYIGIIKLFAGPFAPRDWMFCQGQTLTIAQNTALFSVIGTLYGGDGSTTFRLPDLRGRLPIGMTTAYTESGQPTEAAGTEAQATNGTYYIGQVGGTESVTLTQQQMPMHTHQLVGSTDLADKNTLAGTVLAQSNGMLEDGTPVAVNAYGAASANTAVADSKAITPSGGSQPVDIMPPYMGMNYIICVYGLFPPRN